MGEGREGRRGWLGGGWEWWKGDVLRGLRKFWGWLFDDLDWIVWRIFCGFDLNAEDVVMVCRNLINVEKAVGVHPSGCLQNWVFGQFKEG